MKISVKSRFGDEQVLEFESGAILMNLLADENLVDAVCGGECSCATCHVYIREIVRPAQLPEQSELERELLEELTNTESCSRLSCQIRLSDAMDGMKIEVAAPD